MNDSQIGKAGQRLAQRTERIAPFQVMELVKRASELRSMGKPVIQLDIGEPDFKAPPLVLEALTRVAGDGSVRYTPATGLPQLREAIAADYQRRYGLVIDPARVIVTAGASAALILACAALVEPGDRVLLTDPSYPCNRHFVSAFDGRPQLVAVGPQTRFQMTAELLREHWRPDTRGILIASPSNPTGTSIAPDELARTLTEVATRQGFSIVDEIYLGLSYDDEARSALAFGDDLVVVNSFSKYFAMTGWRLGWLIAPAALVPVFEKLAQNLFICASALAQRAALACFEPATIALCEQRRAQLRTRRDRIVPLLQQAGLDVPAIPDGAFYVYADCAATGVSSGEFASRLLEEHYVSLVPGADFGEHQQDRYLRLSFASALEALEEAAERIGRFTAAIR